MVLIHEEGPLNNDFLVCLGEYNKAVAGNAKPNN